MANDITRLSRHIIDTASGTLILAVNCRIEDVRWVSALAAPGDQAVIQDSTDRIIWESVANEPNYVERDYVNDLATGGYKVVTLDSGILYIRISEIWTEGFFNIFP